MYNNNKYKDKKLTSHKHYASTFYDISRDFQRIFKISKDFSTQYPRFSSWSTPGTIILPKILKVEKDFKFKFNFEIYHFT